VPTVSIVVPCYKYGRYVTECVASLLTNTEVGLDILVIDDASPDDSWSVVRELPRLDPRIRVQRNDQNRGLIATANSGVLAAKGEYLVLLSADDVQAPGWLDRAVGHLEANPRAVLAYGPVLRFPGEVPKVRSWRGSRPVVHAGRSWISVACARGINGIVCPEAVVRTSAQLEVGGYRADLPYTSDMEMWLRLASIGDVIQDRGDYAAFTRVSPQSMSALAETSAIRILEIRRDAFDAWYEFARDRVPGADALLAKADNTLARTAMFRAWLAFTSDPLDRVEADALAKFAMDLDPAWTTGAVRRLDALRDRPLVCKGLQAASPLGRLWFRAHRFGKVALRRLTRFPVK
jgi:glycosyltransferase involved in cell wall biosynthesis